MCIVCHELRTFTWLYGFCENVCLWDESLFGFVKFLFDGDVLLRRKNVVMSWRMWLFVFFVCFCLLNICGNILFILFFMMITFVCMVSDKHVIMG